MSLASKRLIQYAFLFLLSFGLTLMTACRSEETEVSNPTPELVVVDFSTDEAPTQTPTTTVADSDNPQAATTPTQAAVAGVGFSEAGTPARVNVLAVIPANRPSDENPLTGLKVDDPKLLQRRPLMVRVGNDPGARPQVGLNEADIVYEEIVEWWITRFTAIYLSRDPETIAPIRSARLINLQLTGQYQGALANSGGSDQVRWELSQTDIVNLDEYFVPAPYFYRPNEGWQTRLAFDAKAGRDYLAEEELEDNIKLRGFVFADKLDLKTLPSPAVSEAKEVLVPYPKQTSEVKWVYDQANGRYLRFSTGDSFLDFNGDQISAANVVIYFAEHQPTDIVEDSNGATSIRIIMNGKGAAWLLRDGQLLKGNWETNGQETPLFTFDNGQPIPLKPGNTWVEVVPLDYVIEVDGKTQELAAPATENEGNSEEPTKTETPTPTLTPIGARPAATPVSR
jgi:hypothetical protein